MAAVYRLAASLSPGVDGLRSHVEFHRRGRFDATITLHDGRSYGVVRQGLALRRRSLYDRVRAIAEYEYTRRPDTILILTPSVWEERLTTRFCEDGRNLRECFVAVESRDAIERRDLRLWCCTSWVIGNGGSLRWRASAPAAAPGEHLARSRRSGSGRRYPVPSGWRRLRRLSASARLRSGRSTLSRTTR